MAALIVGMENADPAGGFKLPEGFTVPEGTKDGGTFEALVTLKLGPGGMAMPTAVDGVPISAQPKEVPEEDAEMDEDMPFVDRVQSKARPLDPEVEAQTGGY